MTLAAYLKQFKNIAWYPSAYKDALSIISLSFHILRGFGFSKEEVPDCFLFTDYDSHARDSENGRFVLDLDENEDQGPFENQYSSYHCIAFNVRELSTINIPFDREMVTDPCDSYYGRVFTADILVEHPTLGRVVTKLVYVIAENTSFCLNYLIRRNIKIKYVIRSCYGHGFGGGRSSGIYMRHILNELGAEYFITDDIVDGQDDIAIDRYLNEEQKQRYPILQEMIDFSHVTGWCGYGQTIMYKIMGYTEEERHELGFFR